mmetsp:Transcript_14926/g.35363  ORF Transcript_14926/g.35363 Transcript_14926/m.35363 type:complete len:211 (+) Transcript_14926:175-807(+)
MQCVVVSLLQSFRQGIVGRSAILHHLKQIISSHVRLRPTQTCGILVENFSTEHGELLDSLPSGFTVKRDEYGHARNLHASFIFRDAVSFEPRLFSNGFLLQLGYVTPELHGARAQILVKLRHGLGQVPDDQALLKPVNTTDFKAEGVRDLLHDTAESLTSAGWVLEGGVNREVFQLGFCGSPDLLLTAFVIEDIDIVSIFFGVSHSLRCQ